jgi:glyoxylase-like metal-dependent hydrolase (beta-lactamase superfamily II)
VNAHARGDRRGRSRALTIQTLPVGQLQTNCYLVADAKTGEAMVVDPGAESDRIYAAVEELRAAQASTWVKYVVNTHAHFDHVFANGLLMDKLRTAQASPPQLVAHGEAIPLLAQGGGAALFGFRVVPSPEPDWIVGEGDVLRLGAHELQVMHTPGHSSGSISLYCAAENVVLVGDVLFRQGVGRYDLPGGSWAVLLASIRDRLFTLPDETIVYPGHGPATTIGREKKSNPFVS